MIADAIVQADIDHLDNFSKVPGLNSIISEAVMDIVTVFRDNLQLNEDYLNHIFSTGTSSANSAARRKSQRRTSRKIC